jgi:hypothetical protein
MNSAMNDRLRKTETTDIDHTNVTTSSGARNYRLNELLNDTYYGKIDAEIGKKVLADHYDVYLNKDVPNIRSICKHLESSEEHCNRPPFYPFGCTDGKVITSEMARQNTFWARFGSSCGRKFSVKKYVKEHPEYKAWTQVLNDFKGENWIKITI